MTVEVSIWVEVTDPEEFYAAALAKCQEDGLSEDEARELLMLDPEEGDVDHAKCIQTLADPGMSWPGTTIHDSTAEVR